MIPRRGLVLVLALSLGAAACKPGTGKSASGGASPRPGGTLRMAITAPQSIDPSAASDVQRPGEAAGQRPGDRPGVLIVSLICDPLVSSDPGTGALRPGAAVSWAIAPDAKKITFSLRPGLKFHNGRDVSATDYVYSLSRFANPDSGSPEAFFLEKVAGYQDLRARRATALSGLRAVDPLTLEVSLSEPFAELPAVLSNPGAGSAVPKEEVDKGADAFGHNPVCTGPYHLAEPAKRGGDVNLVRFKGYSGPGPGLADEIDLKVVPDAQAGYDMLTQGLVDVAQIPANRLGDATRRKLVTEKHSSGVASYLGFPVGRAPFDKADFRRSLSLAIDRTSIVRDLLGGSRQVSTGFLPPDAGPAASKSACPGALRQAADAAGAAQAEKAAGVDPAAAKINVYFNDGGSGHQAWLEKVGQQWKAALGVDSSLHPSEWKPYLDLLATGQADGPFRLAWPVDYPSPEAFLGPLLSGGSPDNFTGFKDPDFDSLLAKARSTPDDAARRALYEQAAAEACKQVPMAPMWVSINSYGFAAQVSGVAGSRVGQLGLVRVRELGIAS